MKYLIFVLMIGCASRPQLYPNAKYKSESKENREKEIQKCMNEADEFVSSSKGKKMLKGAGGGAAIGAALGGVAGLFSGNLGRGLIQGGSMGAAAGATSGALSPDELKHRYVNQCLADKGYQVIGWD